MVSSTDVKAPADVNEATGLDHRHPRDERSGYARLRRYIRITKSANGTVVTLNLRCSAVIVNIAKKCFYINLPQEFPTHASMPRQTEQDEDRYLYLEVGRWCLLGQVLLTPTVSGHLQT